MENQNSKISIIVPVYNAAKFLEQTIESVINQTYQNWELILVNDGSSDDSVNLIKKYAEDDRIILLEHPKSVNMGVSKSRELGIKKADGDFISFLDSDDIFYPDKLQEQLEVFSKYKEVILVHSRVDILNETQFDFYNEFAIAEKDKCYNLYTEDDWLESNKICNSTVMVKSSIVQSIEFGLPQLFQFEDWLLWSLLAHKGYFFYQNNPQIKYRVHSRSATASILKNSLVYPYSKIEYLISFFLLKNNKNSDSEIIKQLNETLVQLLNIYSTEYRKKNNRKDLEFSKEGSNKVFEKTYKDLYIENLELKKELKEIKGVKFFRLLSKLKNIMNLN